MKRLTEWYDDGQKKGILVKEYPTENSMKTLYQKFGERNDYFDCEEGYLGMEKLKAYEDAEEQGLLLRLPCKFGDTVYWIRPNVSGVPTEVMETKFDDLMISRLDLFGKVFFTTQEEAEQALAEMKGE